MNKKAFDSIVSLLVDKQATIIKFNVIEPLDISNDIVAIKKLGEGVYARVYLLRDRKTNIEFAVRVAKLMPGDQTVTGVQTILANYSMAPKLYYTGRVQARKESFSVSVMDYIMGTVHSLAGQISLSDLQSAFECLLDKKYLLGFLHGDMHTDNIVVLKDGKTLGFIDFDFSYFKVPRKYNILDFIPLLASLNGSTLKKLIPSIIKYYKTKFNIKIEMRQYRAKPKVGGYYYSNYYLNSYISRDRTPLAHFDEVFPSLTLPKIVS